MAATARSKNRSRAAAETAAADRTCQHCGRAGDEMLAAHRLDAIGTALYGVIYASTDWDRWHDVRGRLARIATRLKVSEPELLKHLGPEPGGGAAPRAVPHAIDCEAERGLEAVRSVRARAGVETLAIILDEFYDAYDWNAFSQADYMEGLATQMEVPRLVIVVLVAKACGSSDVSLAEIEAFNAWRAAEPGAASLLEETLP